MEANHDLAFELHQDLITTLAADILPNKGSFVSDTPLGPPLTGTAHISLKFDAIWFNLDSRRTLWRERSPGGLEYDPTRHIALDLDLSGSKMIVQKITTEFAGSQVEYEPSSTHILEVVAPGPPETRAERTMLIPENELPLFGRLTVHDHFAVSVSNAKARNLSIDFREAAVGESPRLVPMDMRAPSPLRFGGSLDASGKFDASIVFGNALGYRASPTIGGKDPRVVWEMNDIQVYWVTSCTIGLLGVIAQRRAHPDWQEPEPVYRFLDEIAAQLGNGVRKELIATGMVKEDGPGGPTTTYRPTRLLPGEGLEVDPDSSAPGTVREMDASGIYWLGRTATDYGGGLRIELRTAEPPIPESAALQYSALADRPAERAALSISTWMVLRSLRASIADQLCIPAESFEFDTPCKLAQPVSTQVDSIAIHLDAFEAVVIPEIEASESTDGARVPGRIKVTGAISKETLYYGLKADFELFVEFMIDEVPQGTKEAMATLAAIGSRIRSLQSELCGLADRDERKAKSDEIKAERDKITALPKSIGLAPIFKPARPRVNRDFWFTPLAYITLLGIVVGAILTGGALAGAAATPAAAVSLLVTSLFFGLAAGIFLAILDAILTAVLVAPMLVGGIEGITREPPEGSALPISLFLPVDVALADDLAVYLSPLPRSLEITCVKKDVAADPDYVIQYIGGALPNDGRTWKVTVPDAVALLKDETREPKQDFYVRLPGSGKRVSVVVAKSALGREYIRTKPDEAEGNNLEDLPACPVTPS